MHGTYSFLWVLCAIEKGDFYEDEDPKKYYKGEVNIEDPGKVYSGEVNVKDLIRLARVSLSPALFTIILTKRTRTSKTVINNTDGYSLFNLPRKYVLKSQVQILLF